MNRYGLTKARSMGPLADLIERAGGSLARVFRRADLPLRLIEQPDRLMLLKDQLALVEAAAHEIGDEALAARLSTQAGFAGLGTYAKKVEAMPDLASAIACASMLIGPCLQSSTQLSFAVCGRYGRWTYGVTEPIEVGRQKNETLALGYMLDLLRSFAGADFSPSRLELGGPKLSAKSTVENVFGSEVIRAERAGIVFPAELLEAPNPRRFQNTGGPAEPELPEPDIVACVETLISLALLDGRPSISWLCRHMETSRRTLQRRLAERGTNFEALLDRVSFARATDLLRGGATATEAAYELGYSHPAHFSRAFRHRAGMAPRVWTRMARAGRL